MHSLRSARRTAVAWCAALAVFASCALVQAAEYPPPEEHDFVIRDFHFRSGESLPELRMHYRTLGTRRRDAADIVRNAVMILHGTTGSSSQFLRAEFAGELFGKGQLLDDARFFRVIGGRWAQFGINGEPRVSNIWRERTIPDDPRRESNVRGTIAFAFAVPNGRTTQGFINLKDNSGTYDPEPFVPFGKVVAGMDVADALNAEYGETAGGGIRGGKQEPVFEQGNAYLLSSRFPRLDYIVRATVIESLAKEQSRREERGLQSASPFKVVARWKNPVLVRRRELRRTEVRAPVARAFRLACGRAIGDYSGRFPDSHLPHSNKQPNNQTSHHEKTRSVLYHGLAGGFALRGGLQSQG
jgi:cyclophilin family peptidyl-prolyl cis-trans isomerase